MQYTLMHKDIGVADAKAYAKDKGYNISEETVFIYDTNTCVTIFCDWKD